MGQRSQIYVAWKNDKGDNILVARYFQWNFAERMISRCSALVQILKSSLEYSFLWNEKEFYKKINRVCDVNFDMIDVSLSINIIKDLFDPFYEINEKDRNMWCFEQQDNNDGQLFVFVDVPDKKVKYGFLKYDLDSSKVMTASRYMNWDYKGWLHDKYLDKEDVGICKENIKTINKSATLLTTEEINTIRDTKYKWEELLEACGD